MDGKGVTRLAYTAKNSEVDQTIFPVKLQLVEPFGVGEGLFKQFQ
jgi:hypothetical protein